MTSKPSSKVLKFITKIQSTRKLTSVEVFDNRRCIPISDCKEVKQHSNGILYWMQRDCRVQDNWALIYAQQLALKSQVPLHVCFFAYPIKEYYPTLRQYTFLIGGLQEVHDELQNLNIKFHLINATATDSLNSIIEFNNIGALVSDFTPLRRHRNDVSHIETRLPRDVPFTIVDAHNVIPCVQASDKQEADATAIWPKITKVLDEYLVEFPEVSAHPFGGDPLKVVTVGFDAVRQINAGCFTTIPELPEIKWAQPGFNSGIKTLYYFLTVNLQYYFNSRSEPCLDAHSNMSPWLHFGQVSAQRCALEVKRTGKNDENTRGFLEGLIVQKELAENYCYYNNNYDRLEGADKWAFDTLNRHRNDKREYFYTKQQLLTSATHDQYWNAAQAQLLEEGKMHGYTRMYWCKKILEWTWSPEEAIETAQYLNDNLSLDGSDPSGFVGVMWSVCGLHDHGWRERQIFGKVRYMCGYSSAEKLQTRRKGVKFNGETPSKKAKMQRRMKNKFIKHN